MNKYYDYAWNPLFGCQGNFIGCTNCFAKALHVKKHPSIPFEQVTLNKKAFAKSHSPNDIVLVCSQSDLFQPLVTIQQQDAILKHILNSPNTQFLVLTKYSSNMKEYFNDTTLLKRLSNSNFNAYSNLNNITIGVTIEHSKYLCKLDDIMAIHSINKKFVAFEPTLDNISESLNCSKLKNITFAIVGNDKTKPITTQYANQLMQKLNQSSISVHPTFNQ